MLGLDSFPWNAPVCATVMIIFLAKSLSPFLANITVPWTVVPWVYCKSGANPVQSPPGPVKKHRRIKAGRLKIFLLRLSARRTRYLKRADMRNSAIKYDIFAKPFSCRGFEGLGHEKLAFLRNFRLPLPAAL